MRIVTPRDRDWLFEARRVLERTRRRYPWTAGLFAVIPSVTQQLQNYVQTTLAVGITNAALTLSVTSAAGFPTSGNFMIRIDDPPPATTFEYCEVTAVAGTTFTITRGQEGTTGIAHNPGAFIGNDLTQAMLMRALPWGWLGYAEVNADQGTFTVATDITGLSQAVTVGTGRRVRIICAIAGDSSVANDTVSASILEGATLLQKRQVVVPGANTIGYSISPMWVGTPSAGSHTYKIQMQRQAGTGNVTMRAASQPAFILIEDIGLA